MVEWTWISDMNELFKYLGTNLYTPRTQNNGRLGLYEGKISSSLSRMRTSEIYGWIGFERGIRAFNVRRMTDLKVESSATSILNLSALK